MAVKTNHRRDFALLYPRNVCICWTKCLSICKTIPGQARVVSSKHIPLPLPFPFHFIS